MTDTELKDMAAAAIPPESIVGAKPTHSIRIGVALLFKDSAKNGQELAKSLSIQSSYKFFSLVYLKE